MRFCGDLRNNNKKDSEIAIKDSEVRNLLKKE